MTVRLYIVAFCMVILLVIAAILYIKEFRDEAQFGLHALTALSVVIAVVVAVYGDALRQVIAPIHLSIELPKNANSYWDEPESNGRKVDEYCHHLSVENHPAYRVVVNCQVWLVGIEDWTPSDGWKPLVQFAAPVLMEWAPNTYSALCQHRMSFLESHVFDFGATRLESGEFQFRKFRDQGGRLDPNCKPGQSRRYVFKIVADNDVTANRFTVEMRSFACTPDGKWPHRWKTEAKIVRS